MNERSPGQGFFLNLSLFIPLLLLREASSLLSWPPGLTTTQIQLASHILTEIDTYAHPPWGVSAQSIVFVIGYQ